MECYIIKNPQQKGVLFPEDFLILNEDGSVKIFPELNFAWEYIDDNKLNDAQIFFLRTLK
jgi:hypothetical protein